MSLKPYKPVFNSFVTDVFPKIEIISLSRESYKKLSKLNKYDLDFYGSKLTNRRWTEIASRTAGPKEWPLSAMSSTIIVPDMGRFIHIRFCPEPLLPISMAAASKQSSRTASIWMAKVYWVLLP